MRTAPRLVLLRCGNLSFNNPNAALLDRTGGSAHRLVTFLSPLPLSKAFCSPLDGCTADSIKYIPGSRESKDCLQAQAAQAYAYLQL